MPTRCLNMLTGLLFLSLISACADDVRQRPDTPPPVITRCGGPNTLTCPTPSDVCVQDEGTCGDADASGVCRPVGWCLGDEGGSVCGCDGQTYTSRCAANTAGVPVDNVGDCEEVEKERCGGFADVTCSNPNDYCHIATEDICGGSDAQGVCQPKPQGCPNTYDPVCGCDGRTYRNVCRANEAGTSIRSEGACTGRAASCGGFIGPVCADPDLYCQFVEAYNCGEENKEGFCQSKPADCPDESAPVCGCDGRTYRNVCLANEAGTSVAADGACDGLQSP